MKIVIAKRLIIADKIPVYWALLHNILRSLGYCALGESSGGWCNKFARKEKTVHGIIGYNVTSKIWFWNIETNKTKGAVPSCININSRIRPGNCPKLYFSWSNGLYYQNRFGKPNKRQDWEVCCLNCIEIFELIYPFRRDQRLSEWSSCDIQYRENNLNWHISDRGTEHE